MTHVCRGRLARSIIVVLALAITGLIPAAAHAGPQLAAGESLTNNQYLTSPNGRFQFLVDAGGAVLIRYATGSKRTLWTATSVGIGGRVTMQRDGNLVAYDKNRAVRWATGTNGRGATNAAINDAGSLKVRKGTAPVWSSRTKVFSLWSGDALRSGWAIVAPGGTFKLAMQQDGNLVLRRISNGNVAWSSLGVSGKRVPGSKAIMQPDGNLVVYSPAGDPLWASGTYAGGSASAVVSDVGAISVRRGGDIIWNSAGPYSSRYWITTSSNWGGYAVRPSYGKRVTSVTGDLTVPRVYCNNFKQQRFFTMWVGLDGFGGSRTVQQAGINLSCPAGTVGVANPWAWWETYPEPAKLMGGPALKAGDHITISVASLGGNTFRMSVVNHTTGKSASKTHTMVGATAQLTSAEWVVEKVGMDLAPFSSLSFFNSKAQQTGGAMQPMSSFSDLTQLRLTQIRFHNGVRSDIELARPTPLTSPTAFHVRRSG